MFSMRCGPQSGHPQRVKKKLAVIGFAITLLIPMPAIAQNCFPDDILLATQTEVDNFQLDHGPCDVVVLGLGLSNALDPDQIMNLDGLNGITAIGTGLSIQFNPILTSMTGLSSLLSVPSIEIIGNDMLTNLKWPGCNYWGICSAQDYF